MGLIASVKSIGRVRDGHILFYVQLIVLQTKDYKDDPSRKKGTYRSSYLK